MLIRISCQIVKKVDHRFEKYKTTKKHFKHCNSKYPCYHYGQYSIDHQFKTYRLNLRYTFHYRKYCLASYINHS